VKFSWSKNQRSLLSRYSASTTAPTCYSYHKYGPRRLLYFAAGQCASQQSQI